MASFIGPNWGKFEAAFGPWSEGRHAFSWNWAAFFVPIPWMLYRRMYMECGLMVLAVAVIGYIAGGSGSWSAAVVAMLAKPIYFMHAQRKIGEIRKAGGSPADVAARIAAAGGVSPVGAWVGGILMFAAIALVVMAGLASA
ncbi:MAG: DUF2628 domain-containing protein [Alphaproteobacteria bacterium]|nr:DUF2628 domain-containing protein [Alphaproteobacteria bacterium]